MVSFVLGVDIQYTDEPKIVKGFPIQFNVESAASNDEVATRLKVKKFSLGNVCCFRSADQRRVKGGNYARLMFRLRGCNIERNV